MRALEEKMKTFELLDFERPPPIRALSGICGVICIWGGPLRDLGLQLSGVEGGDESWLISLCRPGKWTKIP